MRVNQCIGCTDFPCLDVRHENYYGYMTEITEHEGGGLQHAQEDNAFTSGDTNADVYAQYTEGPWFDKVLFTIYNADAAVMALDAGEVDFILTPNGLSKGQVEQLTTNPNIDAAVNPAQGFRYLPDDFGGSLCAR